MADDLNDQVFSEKQLYNNDVLGEDEIQPLPYELPSTDNGCFSPTSETSTAEKSRGNLSVSEKRRKKAAERATKIVYWLETKYEIFPEVCESFDNWKEAPSASSDFDLLWCDQPIPADRFAKLKPYQKMNHFVGMSAITRKNNMGRNLLRMRKQFPQEYKFFPDTWILPTDLSDFKLQFTPARNKTFIIKPDTGCQGKGIFLIRDADKVPVDFSTSYIAQRYVHKPFLLDGHKFDLRLYVLVMGCDPLRIFLHKRGLVRLASEQYVEPTVKNLSATTVHLTNYAVNKMNPNFEENTNPDDPSDGHKRSWEAVADYLRKLDYDVDTMMGEIEDLLIKTLIAVQPSLSHFYHSCQPDDVENSMCFEILGFDVMLDYKLQPWLLEVNHAPSFGTESELDKMVKEEVISDAFVLLNLSPETRRRHKREAREKMEQRVMREIKKKSLEERSQEEHEIAKERTAWEDANLNGYKRLYPSEEKERKYSKIHDAATNIWDMLMGGNSRRSVRLTHESLESTDDAVVGKTKKGNDSTGPNNTPGIVKEKRTADEMREVVERLSAGCSARPRDKPQKRASKPEFNAGRMDAFGTADACDGQSESVQRGPHKKSGAQDGRVLPPRPEVHVGDVVRVQTNLGWECVVVKAKRTNGKIDIQFKDGEYMRSVLPRILREQTLENKESEKNDQARQQTPTSLPSPRAPQAKDEISSGLVTSMLLNNSGPLGSIVSPSGISPVNAYAGIVGSSDIKTSTTGLTEPDPKVNDVLASMTSLGQDRDMLSQLRNHQTRASNFKIGGGIVDTPLSLASLHQPHPMVNSDRGLRASQTSSGMVSANSAGCGSPEVNRVHEVRLRNQLQQLISVRPIVTRRKQGNLESDLTKSPRSETRRHTFGTQR